jgi:hypothetical protein
VRWLEEGISVRDGAPALSVQLAGFNCTLSDGLLIAAPQDAAFSVDDARSELEPALHAWEAASELGGGPRFSFVYAGSSVENTTSNGQRAVGLDDVAVLIDSVKVSRELGAFPAPDPSLPIEHTRARDLRLRWREQREGGERLLGTCYAILTAA